jgi:hypothetical protein
MIMIEWLTCVTLTLSRHVMKSAISKCELGILGSVILCRSDFESGSVTPSTRSVADSVVQPVGTSSVENVADSVVQPVGTSSVENNSVYLGSDRGTAHSTSEQVLKCFFITNREWADGYGTEMVNDFEYGYFNQNMDVAQGTNESGEWFQMLDRAVEIERLVVYVYSWLCDKL